MLIMCKLPSVLDIALLDIVGVRMIRVPDLGMEALILLKRGLVLVDDALGEDATGSVVDRVISAAAASLTAAC